MTDAMQGRRQRRVVGLDVHPYMFSMALLAGEDALSSKVEWVIDKQPLDRLEELIGKKTEPGDVVAMEAGGNSFIVSQRIAACGREPIVLESQSVGKVGKTYCATDKVDAVKIARVYMSGLAHVVWKPDAKSSARRDLFFAYRNSVRDAVRCRNRVWAWFNSNGLRQPKDFRLSEPGSTKKLLAIKDWTRMQRTIIESNVSAFQEADKRRTAFNAMIAEEVASDPETLKLTRLLGIKHIVALALMAFIGTIHRFGTPRKLTAYFGLMPNVCTSGIGGGNGSLAHCGRSDVRSLLIQASQSIMRYGSGTTHKWAVALKMRKGASLAITALARKLVVSVWYLLMGCFTPMSEISKTVSIKIHKIVTLIGSKRIKALGYKSPSTFKKEKLELLLSTT
jgi:transposase